MKMPIYLVLALASVICSADLCQAQESTDLITRFEKSQGKETATYSEGIAFYRALADAYPTIRLLEMGPTDSGRPLHLVIYDASEKFDFETLRKEDKAVVLINNAIHPGEPDGVEASMMLLRDIAQKKVLSDAIEDVVLAIIPFYNIGGALNRNAHSRVNQVGPAEYGFRGNGRNYDLNRDFIKCDTRNARSFAQIFHLADPDLFIDTHVSNGADYQYVMTLVSTQSDKLGGALQVYQDQHYLPFLYKHMEKSGFPMTPYVNVWGDTPDHGWVQFPDWPRYSSGYVALFQTVGCMSETHMLKSFDQRVQATYALLSGVVEAASTQKVQLLAARAQAKKMVQQQQTFPLTWSVDTSYSTSIEFKGYEGSYIDSEVTSGQRLFYDRSKPYSKKVPFRNRYQPDVVVDRPSAYVIPQAWHNVIDLLKLNNVQMQPLASDTSLEVSVYHIDDYETARRVFEGHYPHQRVAVSSTREMVVFQKGDVVIHVDQPSIRYIVETLEPEAVDAFFRWNFFDPILQQKEGFSPYVFEDRARELLLNDPGLKRDFDARMRSDSDFAQSWWAQLTFIYQRSPHMEKAYRRYPIYRIEP